MQMTWTSGTTAAAKALIETDLARARDKKLDLRAKAVAHARLSVKASAEKEGAKGTTI
jgi:hypothetical protein